MTVHLIKLSVGPDSLADLANWQKGRLAEMKRRGQKQELMHITRQMPKRAEEVLDNGSIYWVIRGFIVARQKLLELRPLERDGIPHCGLVLDHKLVNVQMRPRKAFQGWRYFNDADVPPDIAANTGIEDMPEKLQRKLAILGLI